MSWLLIGIPWTAIGYGYEIEESPDIFRFVLAIILSALLSILYTVWLERNDGKKIKGTKSPNDEK